MMYKKILILLIIFLSAVCLFEVLGIWKITNWYDLLVLFIILIFPFDIALFFISFYLKKHTEGWEKNIAFIGLFIATVSIMVPVSTFFWDYYNWRIDSLNYKQYVQPNVLKEFQSNK